MAVGARWVDPSQRKGSLTAYAREAETKTLELLEKSIAESAQHMPNDVIQSRLLTSASRDIGELLPQLEPRAKELAALAEERLHKRGEREAADLTETLQRQRDRVRQELVRNEGEFQQLTLGFDEDEKRQLESNMRSWRVRLEQFDRELTQEPQRIQDFYAVRAQRIEPVGLVYLWPESN
jgi:hypothetical protein